MQWREDVRTVLCFTYLFLSLKVDKYFNKNMTAALYLSILIVFGTHHIKLIARIPYILLKEININVHMNSLKPRTILPFWITLCSDSHCF